MGTDPLDVIKFQMDTAEFMQAAASVCGPLWWSIPGAKIDSDRRNGTTFFMRIGTRLIGVTAAHVILGWKSARRNPARSPLCLTGPSRRTQELNWENREIACDAGMDIATFSINEDELAAFGLESLPHSPEPCPSRIGQWVTYCGFPGAIRERPTPTATVFKMCVATGKLTALNDRNLTIQLEREYLRPLWEGGLPPEGFSFGGMSGGPLFRNFTDENGHLQAVVAGVISGGRGSDVDDEGKHIQRIEGLELITASRAEFIKTDGTLDTERWANLAIGGMDNRQ
jgi:hypothetical protein